MYLMDSHAILWALTDDPRFGSKARELFLDDEAPLLVSAASLWELALEISIGKLSLSRDLGDLADRELAEQGIPVVPIEARHAIAVRGLPFHHRDPFDRLLVATALVDGLTIVSRDPVFDAYGVTRVW